MKFNSFIEVFQSHQASQEVSQLCRYFLYATSEKSSFKQLFAVISIRNFFKSLRAVHFYVFTQQRTRMRLASARKEKKSCWVGETFEHPSSPLIAFRFFIQAFYFLFAAWKMNGSLFWFLQAIIWKWCDEAVPLKFSSIQLQKWLRTWPNLLQI